MFACVVRPVPTPMVFAAVFGVPGQKTRECHRRGAFRQRIVSGVDDGGVRVSGLNKGVESLKAALDEAEEQIPDVVAALKTAGMLCVRVKRPTRIPSPPALNASHVLPNRVFWEAEQF